jgi:cell division control protein 6
LSQHINGNIESSLSSTGNIREGGTAEKLMLAIDRYLARPSVFKNKDALSIHYIPDQLYFRDQQIMELGHILAPLLRSEKSSNALLYGKPGTGKTVVARFVMRHITTKASEIGCRVRFCYCNAKLAGTEYRLILDVARQANVDLPFTGLSVAEALSRLKASMLASESRMLLILDEIDHLVKHHGDHLLYELTRSTGHNSASGLFSLVGISNDLTFKDWLDPRVLSSLAEEEMVFPPYTVDQLKAILAARAESAFRSGCLSEGALNLCAALSGSEHGDARRAVELLRVAGELADREQSSRIEERHVEEALHRIENDRTNEAITTLPLHAKLLLAVAVDDGANSTGAIYERYSKMCQQVGLNPVTRRRASGILSELDVLGLLNVEVVSSGRYGRTKRVKPNLSVEVIKRALQEEPLIAQAVN